MVNRSLYAILSAAIFFSLIAFPCLLHGQTGDKDHTARLVVSFISICCGIDHEAKDKLDSFIARYEKTKGKQLTKATSHWGREGEIDYCFQLSEQSRKERKTFISKVRSLIGKSKLVDIKENASCQTGR